MKLKKYMPCVLPKKGIPEKLLGNKAYFFSAVYETTE